MKKTFNLRKKNEVDELLKLLNKDDKKHEVIDTQISDRINGTKSPGKMVKPTSAS